ncbi:MAG: hypothetical protein AB1665_07695 [Candidatus Thermoplasmatota archaeon]
MALVITLSQLKELCERRETAVTLPSGRTLRIRVAVVPVETTEPNPKRPVTLTISA